MAAPVTAALLVAFVLGATRVPAANLAVVERETYACPKPGFVCVRRWDALARPTIALMGDSIAKSLDPAILKLSERRKWTYVAAAANRCSLTQRWIAQSTPQGPARLVNWDLCYDAIPQIHREVLSHDPRLIVATDRWLAVKSFDDSGRLLLTGSDEHIRDVESRLEATTRLLVSKGATLVFIHVLPAGRAVECADPRYASDPKCTMEAADDPVTPKYNAMMDRIAARLSDRVKVIDLSDVVCPGGGCPPFLGGVLIRGDRLHFTAPGAEWLEPHIERKLEQVGVRLE